jgi:hypothetical protein
LGFAIDEFRGGNLPHRNDSADGGVSGFRVAIPFRYCQQLPALIDEPDPASAICIIDDLKVRGHAPAPPPARPSQAHLSGLWQFPEARSDCLFVLDVRVLRSPDSEEPEQIQAGHPLVL